MNVAFVLDTSFSMAARTEKGIPLMDIAKAAIETFVSMRIRITEGDDKFFLFTTDSTQNVVSSWQHPIEHFIHSLRELAPTRYE